MNINGGSAVSNTAAAEGGAFWNGTGVMTVSGVSISEKTSQVEMLLTRVAVDCSMRVEL
ncbi:MAG: hypothetical protein R2879_03250 [Saprospiraceae bacterium]